MSARISHISFASVAIVLSLALSLIPQSSFAFDIISDVNSSAWAIYPTYQYCTDLNTNSGASQTNKCAPSSSNFPNKRWSTTASNRLQNGSTIYFTSISGIRISTGASSIPSGSIIAFPFLIGNINTMANSYVDTVGVMVRPNTGNKATVIGEKYETMSNGGARWTVFIKANFDLPANTAIELCSSAVDGTIATGDVGTLYSYNFLWFSSGVSSGILGSNGIVYQPSSSSGYDDTDVINALSSLTGSVQSLNSKLDSINSNSDDILSALGDLQDSTTQANTDANDRYQDEKDTINDSRDEAEASANSMDTSGFSLGNPFSSWFGMFTDNQCVDIPKLASWIHSNETRVCTPWSSDVRSNLTPIISVIAIMVGFGLLVHWLKGDTDVGLENT